MIDLFEENDNEATPAELFLAGGVLDYDDLTVQPGDEDWYLFTLASPGRVGDRARIDFVHDFGDVDLQLYDENAVSVLRSSAGITDSEQVELSGLVAGSYLLRVYAYGTFLGDQYYRLRLNVTPSVVNTGDRFEQNDSAGSPTDLATLNGEQEYSDLSVQAGDDDWYRITLASAGRVGDLARIEFVHALGDVDLQLYNAAGSTVLRSSTGVSDREEIDLAGLTAATYLLRVYGFGANTSNPSYQLHLNATPSVINTGDRYENNDTANTATDLRTLNGEQEYSDLSVQAGDDDWYRFTLASAGRVGDLARIEFVHALGDVDLQLYNEAGSTVLRSSTGVADREEIDLSGLAAGSYLLKVYGYEANTSNPSYQLRLNAAPSVINTGDRYEDNDTANTATDLRTLNGEQEYSDLSVQAGDDDWYRFTLASAGRVGDLARIEFVHALGDVDLQLYNEAGSTVLRSSTGVSDREEIDLSGLAAGTYLLKVYGYGANTSNPSYQLRLNAAPSVINIGDRYEDNDTANTATDLRTLNGEQEYSDLSVQAGDADWYRFTLASAGRVGDVARIEFVHALGDLDLQLYNQAGSTILRSSTGVSDREEIDLSGLTDGTYLLKVYGYGANTSNPSYQLRLNAAPSVINTGDRYEDNDTANTATDLRTLNGEQEYSDLSVQAGDADWYRFTLASAGRVGDVARIEFVHALGDLDLQLYNQAGSTILRSSTGVGDREEIDLSGLAAGSYLLKVYGAGANTSNPSYRLHLNAAPSVINTGDRYEDNDTANTATDLRTLNGEQEYSDLSVQPGDADWYRFTLASAGRVGDVARIEFVHALGDLDLQLYRADGSPMLPSSTGVTDREEIDLSGLAAGTYLLKVYGFGANTSNPNYRLHLNAAPAANIQLLPDRYEANDTAATPTLLRESTVYQQGLTITAGDQDWYRFSLAQPGVLADRVTVNADAAMVLQLYNASSSQTPLTTVTSTQAGSLSLPLTGRPAGDYRIRLTSPSTTGQANYDLRVETTPLSSSGGGSTPPAAAGTWSVLVFLNGDNNLEQFAIADLNEMEAASLGTGIRVAVQVDRIGGFDASNGDWVDTRRGIISRDGNLSTISSTLSSIGEIDMGSTAALTNFINWGVQNAPADNYALVIWDHGGGALLGSSFDDSQPASNGLSVREVSQAISASSVGKVDLLGFDACFMAAAEQAYEVSSIADRIVASIKTIPGPGWDYTSFLNAFSAERTRSTDALAANIVSSYGRFYDPSEYLSSVDLGSLQTLTSAIDSFAQVMAAATSTDWAAVTTARLNSYQVDDTYGPGGNNIYIDLGSFMAQLAVASGNTAIDTAANRVISALQTVVLNETGGRNDVRGLSVVFPQSGSLSTYGYSAGQYTFLNQTRWDDFLNAYLTRAAARTIEAPSVTSSDGRAVGDTTASDFAETLTYSGRSSGFSSNDISEFAFDVGSLVSSRILLNGLLIASADDQDWFRFNLPSSLASQPHISLLASGNPSAGLLVTLLDSEGITQSTVAADSSGQAVLGLAGLTPDKGYFLRVEAESSVAYSINFAAGAAAGVDPFDASSRNDSLSKATLLGDADEMQQRGALLGLSIDGTDVASGSVGGDWYRVASFRTTEANASSVRLSGAAGLGLFVYTNDGQLLASATDNVLQKQAFFDQQIDDIYIQVRPLSGQTDDDYSLSVFNDEPPRLVAISPTDGELAVPIASNIVLTFSEEIFRGTGSIQLRRGTSTGDVVESFNIVDSNRLDLAGNSLTINPTAELIPNTQYFVVVSSAAVTDAAGNRLAGVGPFTFTTISPLIGTSSNDSLIGSFGNDTIDAFAGNDTIDGLAGDDILTGGIGIDRFLITSGSDVIMDLGAGGADAVVVSANATVIANLAANWTAPSTTRNSGIASIVTPGRAVNLASVTSGAAGFTVTNTASATTLSGSAFADALLGGSGHDTLLGGAGNDTLRGNGGNDSLVGGTGSDLFVLAGSDNIADYNSNQADAVSIAGLLSADLVTFQLVTGSLDLSGSTVGTGFRVNGVVSPATIVGGSGLDSFVGGTGADNLSGGVGKDTLNGGAGNDTLIGGAGEDNLIGGSGRDVYVFASGDSGQASGFDSIISFAKGSAGIGDLIDYSTGLSVGGTSAAPTSSEAAINQTTGVVSFATGSGATITDALDDIATRFRTATDASGEFALFRVNKKGNFFLFISDGQPGITSGDVVTQLGGVTSITSLNLTNGNLAIIS